MSEENPLTESQLLRDISGLQMTPFNIRRIFLLLTRLHYSNSSHYGDAKQQEQFRNYTWDQDPTKSGIKIDFDYHYNPETLDKFPAIFVGTDDYAFKPLAVDNYHSTDLYNAGEVKARRGETAVIIRHVSSTPDEALQLGDLSYQFFSGIDILMRETLKLVRYEVPQLKTAKPFLAQKTEADQQFSVDLLIQIAFNATWLIVRESHVIKSISLEAAQQFASV